MKIEKTHTKNNLLQKLIFKNSENEMKSSYIWNILSSLFISVSSVLAITIFTRVTNFEITGYYSLAVAVSTIAYSISTYNLYNYQITDINNRFDFSDYFSVRIITNICAILFIIVYSILKYESLNKNSIIIFQCLYRCADSFIEVFQGEYQKQNKFFIGSRLSFIEHFISDMSLFIIVIIFKNIVIAIIAANIIKILILIYSHKGIQLTYISTNIKKVFELIKVGLPLFISAFLISYIQSAPKFFIDKYLEPEKQTYFTIIFMPAMIIYLFSSIFYRPLITRISLSWNKKDFKNLQKTNITVLSIILLITLFSVIGANLVGVPILNLIFNIDISEYRVLLLVNLASGGINALCNYLLYFLILDNKRGYLLFTYLVTSLVSFFGYYFTMKYELYGTTLFYFGTIFIQLILMLIGVISSYRKLSGRSDVL